MKKNNLYLKKSTLCAIIMGAALCFSACGSSTDETPAADTAETENVAADTAQAQEPNTSAESTEESTEEEAPAESGSETDITVSDMDSPVSITMETADTVELTTEDGIVYYTVSCSYPVVSIEGNDAAAEKINADISTRVDNHYSGVNSDAESAKEDFEYMLADAGEGNAPDPYTANLSFTVVRADDNVISFTEDGYIYMGGAHGSPSTIGVNYDAKTGELIAFTDLSDDPDAFHADTLAYNQELAQTDYYSSQMFSTDDITNGTLEDTLYADDAWYLSPAGLVFMSAPYAIAPYAAGTLEFTIPYSDLNSMGFNDAYAYTGRQIVKLLEGNTYSTDLNGDGSEDSVDYSTEYLDDDSYDILTHLIVNGTDYAQDGTVDVKEQLTDPTSSQPYVYDLDVNDNYVELAAVFEEWVFADDASDPVVNRYSRFFRYTADGSLIYLGQVDGNVADLTFTFTSSDFH